MKDKIAVEVRDLNKRYPGVSALEGLTVDIPRGMITGLIGPNGSGKSTLLKSIAGLVQATSGEIKVLDLKPGIEVKEQISFLPEINHFYKWMTIKQVIDLYASQYQSFDRENAIDLISFMNLKPENKIKNLSKGMVGRVKIVLAMSRKVPLLIMDEPLSGIDPNSRARILESLISEYDAEKQTVLLSTHEVLEAERFFDYVIFLEDGKIKLQGNTDDLRKERGKSIQDLVKEVFR